MDQPHPLRPRAAGSPRAGLDRTDLALYAATVFLWGTSWIAIRAQLGVVAPEVSAFWRFLVAAAAMWIWVALKGERLAYGARDHLLFAATGLFLFSTNFTLFYYGGLTVPSGLLAVVFSLASVFNLVLGWALLGQRVEARVAAGGLVGTLCFCVGNLVATAVQRRGVALLPAVAWGMTYGLVVLLAVSLARRQAF